MHLISIENFWSHSNFLKIKSQDDQVRINHLLDKTGINWYTTGNCRDIKHCNITGLTSDGLKVTLLSQDIICRSCNSNNTHAIWHGLTSKTSSSKMSKEKEERVWYLVDNWKTLLNSQRPGTSTGSDFIKGLTQVNHIR